MRMEDVHHPHHHHPYQHQDMMRSGSMHNNNKLHNNNNNILSSSMASMASLAASVGMSVPSNQHLPISSSGQQQQQQMMLGVQQQQQPVISHLCAGCGQLIKDRYLLQALDSYWHEDCLKCSCCGCRLGEVGSNLFTKANLILCKRDYLRLFGATGNCAACCKAIPAFEMVMRAKSNVYHLDCFACQQCHQRFCVGDRFYLCDNQILCEYDYEERLIFANLATSSSSSNSSGCVNQQQQQPATAQPFNNRTPLLPPPTLPTSSSPSTSHHRQSEESTSTNITARIIWNNPTGTPSSIASNVVGEANNIGEPSSSTSPDTSAATAGHAEEAAGLLSGNIKPKFHQPDSSPGGGGGGQQQQQQLQQQQQVVEHDASSSGYGSPDSGGLIDEG